MRFTDQIPSTITSGEPKIPNESPPPLPPAMEIKKEDDVTMPEEQTLGKRKRSNTIEPDNLMIGFKRLKTDLSDPGFLKPFQFGWKRELVYRATMNNAMKKSADIYYYSPNGKKLRSMREVSGLLKNTDLTLDNFTYYPELLGLNDPEKEIIRQAKSKYSSIKKVIPKPKGTSPKPRPPPPPPSSPYSPASPVNTPALETPKVTEKAAKPVGSAFKVKVPKKAATRKGRAKRIPKQNGAETEMGTYPLNRKAPQKKKTMATKWGMKRTRAAKSKPPPPTTAVNKPNKSSKLMENYFQKVAHGYGSLLCVFQYLKVQDLLRAGCVCTMWRDVANHPVLWRTVRMKNSQIYSFEGLADTLHKHGTVNLDLRKMLLPNDEDDLWPSFSKAIVKVESLRKIELCRCPAVVVEQLATTNPKLEVINAVTIKCENMTLEPFGCVLNLQELRLKSTAALTLSSDLSALKELKHLQHLSLTSIKDLNKLNIEVIADLCNLESLDLGECTDFPNTFGSGILTKLEKLGKLRLEKGLGTCYLFEILEVVKNMPKLEQLELVNFDIKSGFEEALGACTNIKKLLIIPTYISHSATTNHMVVGGLLRLRSTLSHLVWGVTSELLRVTELFFNQYDDFKKEKNEKKSPGNEDRIPILKPIPFLGNLSEQAPQATEPAQVEILPLLNLQKLLLENLPTTRVKILKIPYHETWRQTINGHCELA